MLRQISEDVRVNLKDRLRELRDAIRQSRHDSAGETSHDIAGNLPPFPGRSLLGHALEDGRGKDALVLQLHRATHQHVAIALAPVDR